MPGPITNPGTAVPPSETSLTIAASAATNPNYQVVLSVSGDEALLTKTSTGKPVFPIIANMGEKYNIEFSSSWDDPFGRTNMLNSAASKVLGAGAADILEKTVNASGYGSKIKGQSAQVWSGSSPMEFSFEMNFNAISDTSTEIRDRHIAMLKLCAPSEIGFGMMSALHAPGPSLLGGAIKEDSRRISLQVGNYLFLDNVVIESVSSDVTALHDENGTPIQITIAVKVKSFFACFTTTDIDNMFNNVVKRTASGPTTP